MDRTDGGGHEASGRITVCIVRAPHSAVPEEFEALAAEANVDLAWVDHPEELGIPDMVILPGSEATIPDLTYLRAIGMDAAIREAAERGSLLFGICGGFQMMGTELADPEGLEGDEPRAQGLGIFALTTTFTRDKIDERVRATGAGAAPGSAAQAFLPEGAPVAGYELHGGQSVLRDGAAVPLFLEATLGSPACPLGIATRDYAAMGTYLHGVLADPVFRSRILEHLRVRRRTSRESTPARSA